MTIRSKNPERELRAIKEQAKQATDAKWLGNRENTRVGYTKPGVI